MPRYFDMRRHDTTLLRRDAESDAADDAAAMPLYYLSAAMPLCFERCRYFKRCYERAFAFASELHAAIFTII